MITFGGARCLGGYAISDERKGKTNTVDSMLLIQIQMWHIQKINYKSYNQMR